MELENEMASGEAKKGAKDKAKFIRLFGYFGLVIGLILAVENLYLENFFSFYATITLIFILALNFIQVRIFKAYKLGVAIGVFSFAAVIAFLFLYGEGNIFIWIGPFGAATFFLMGSKNGFYVTMSFFVLISIAVLANDFGLLDIPFPKDFKNFGPDFVASSILLFLFILIFQETVEKEQRRIEESVKLLEEEHKKDRSIFSTIETGIITANDAGIINFINEQGYKLLGRTPKEVIGQPIRDAIKLEKSGKPLDEKANPFNWPAGGKTVKIRLPNDLSLRRDNKNPIPVGMDIAYSDQDPDTRITVAFFDLSIEKRIDDLKDAFLASMQHQIATPFSIIKWNVELLGQSEEDLKKIGLSKDSIISETMLAINRISQIQANIITLSKLEQGFFPQGVETINPKELVEEAIKHLYLNAKNKRKEISIKTSYGKNLNAIRANKTIMSIIMENVISNAVKYSPREGAVSVDVKQEKETVLFKISDKGIGIPEEERGRIFSKFFRSEKTAKSYEGTGLGLHITKILVSHLRGEIYFESVEDAGTTFYIRIPNSPPDVSSKNSD